MLDIYVDKIKQLSKIIVKSFSNIICKFINYSLSIYSDDLNKFI